MSGAFKGELITVYDAKASKALGGNFWRVVVDFEYHIGGDPEVRVVIPAGYLTDGASVPRAFWSVVPPWGQYGAAVVVHDLLCEYLSYSVKGKPRKCTRAQADAILLEAMQALEVPHAMAAAIYDAVCLYRITSGVSKPTNRPDKRALEAAWVNPLEAVPHA